MAATKDSSEGPDVQVTTRRKPSTPHVNCLHGHIDFAIPADAMSIDAMPEAVKATMQWRGRKLMCNGVCVAHFYKHAATRDWHGTGGGFATNDEFDFSADSQRNCRRAVNRRFGLPLDFGARP